MLSEERLVNMIHSLPPAKRDQVADFVEFLSRRESHLGDEIATYAAEFGGSEVDLDEDLEQASLESLTRVEEVPA